MKKYLPISLFILAFSGYLFFQVVVESSDVEAGLVSSTNRSKLHLENLFQKTKFATFDGKEIELTALSTPVVIINFWASWCSNCLLEIPTMVELQKRMDNKNITIISINTDNARAEQKIKSAIKKYNIDFHVVADVDGLISNDFNISAIPTTLVYKKGKLEEVHKGVIDFSSEEFIQKLK